MAYNQNIPQAGDQISTSQADLLANFQAIQTWVSINHEDFASATTGQHKFLTFPVQVAAPATPATSFGIFNKLPVAPFPVNGVNELFITNSSGVTTMMAASKKTAVGWSYLPSGIILKWGTAVGNGTTTYTFPVAATEPAFNTVLAIYLTPVDAAVGDVNTNVRLIDFTNLQFRAYFGSRTTLNTPAASTCQYLAIGY